MKISTITRFNLNPIIIVLNNKGYGTEWPQLDGPFNDILPWNYSQIPRIIDDGKGFDVETEDELEESLSTAETTYCNELCILDVHLDAHDGVACITEINRSIG